jgi:hypothetical protein
MKCCRRLLLIPFCVMVCSSSRNDIPASFAALLNEAQLVFTPIPGMEEEPVHKMKRVAFQYAMKSEGKKSEVKFFITPLPALVRQYDSIEKVRTEGDINIDPNTYFLLNMQSMLTALCGKDVEIISVNSDSVKRVFNADQVITAFVGIDKKADRKHRYCKAVGIHKQNTGDAYWFYFTNDEGYRHPLQPGYVPLRFR